MPQILIVTDSTESVGEVVYRERVDAVHLASEHSRCQLAERLAWGSAMRRERSGPSEQVAPADSDGSTSCGLPEPGGRAANLRSDS